MNNISLGELPFQENQTTIQQSGSTQKSIDELNMMDSFLFEAATEDMENAKRIAKIIIERTTGHKVENLIVESQKQLKGINIDKRGIRMDIYTTEWIASKGENKLLRVFDIEPNHYREKELPRRNRFYQSTIDSKLLSAGSQFQDLPDIITIWILSFDPFGDNRMIYSIKNIVEENNQIVYNDGVWKFYLYTGGTRGGSKELKELLTYLENSVPANAVDAQLQEIQDIVDTIKHSSEARSKYMNKYFMGVSDYEERDFREACEKIGEQRGEIRGTITVCKSLGVSCENTKAELIKNYDLTEEKAEEYLKLYW